MKTTSLFLTITSVASVFAAAVPGATDMSSTAASDTSRQVNTASEQSPLNHQAGNHQAVNNQTVNHQAVNNQAVNHQAVNNQAVTPDVIQGTSPVLKQEASPVQEEEDSGYTPFYITSPGENVTYIKGDVSNIQWSNGINGPFLIHVLTGRVAKSMVNTNVTLRGEGSKGFYDWIVPGYLSDGIYSFQFSFKNNGIRQETYSPIFNIVSSRTH